MTTVVVTRHAALVTYLVEAGIIGPDARVIEHATDDDVRGRHVVGVLPLRLAAMAETITEVPLIVPPEARGRELSVEDIRTLAGTPTTYCVRKM